MTTFPEGLIKKVRELKLPEPLKDTSILPEVASVRFSGELAGHADFLHKNQYDEKFGDDIPQVELRKFARLGYSKGYFKEIDNS